MSSLFIKSVAIVHCVVLQPLPGQPNSVDVSRQYDVAECARVVEIDGLRL